MDTRAWVSAVVGQLRWAGILLLCGFYLAYVGFVVFLGQGPIDYQTFMTIGERFLRQEAVYLTNSYYPMPYVMIFAVFAWLPRPLSIGIWLVAPVLVALAVRRWNVAVLLFAPLFGHFVGGQTALFSLLGLWGYRKFIDRPAGGFWLALLTLKPQLALFPIVWALMNWSTAIRIKRRLPAQASVFMLMTAIIYGPSLVLYPEWPQQWLSQPRPLFERALAGIVPRALIQVTPPTGWLFWVLLGIVAIALLLVIGRLSRGGRPTFEMFILWGFCINPLAHDYDLLQLVPLLDTSRMLRAALVLSIPGWLVILLAYSSDAAWAVFSVIPPGLLAMCLLENGRLAPRPAAISLTPA